MAQPVSCDQKVSPNSNILCRITMVSARCSWVGVISWGSGLLLYSRINKRLIFGRASLVSMLVYMLLASAVNRRAVGGSGGNFKSSCFKIKEFFK